MRNNYLVGVVYLLFVLVGCEIRPLNLQEVDVAAVVGEEFELALGETAVVRNSDLIIRNQGEGSEYYDDENGNEIHVYNIQLDVNGETVWLDDIMPEAIIGDYVIQWQVGDRLLVTEVGEVVERESVSATVTVEPTSSVMSTATPAPMATATPDGAAMVIEVGEAFELALGETAVVRNTDLIMRNEGEGSEYYDDENGNEVHVYNIKLDVNGEIVWLDDTMPETMIGNYVVHWQVGNRLLVTEK